MFENYTLLGKYGHTYFVNHCETKNPLFTHTISSKIYNELIKNNILNSPTENIIIYSKNAYKNEYKIIIIQHEIELFDVKILSDFYYKLLNNKTLNITNIRYEYEGNSYQIQNINLYYLPYIPPEHYVPFDEIVYLYKDFYNN
jgi:hypothetical protein